MICIVILALLGACAGSPELRDVPRATLVLVSGTHVEVVQTPEGTWSSIRTPNGADALGVDAQQGTRLRIIGAPSFLVDIRELKVVSSNDLDGKTYIVPSPDRGRRIVLSGCRNRADSLTECELRVLDGEHEIFKTKGLSSSGLPVWKDGTTFFFVGSSGALFRADSATRAIFELEGRGRVLCAYLPAHDALLTTERGGIALLDPTTGGKRLWLVQKSEWNHVGPGAVMSPDERFLVYSRKRLWSEGYDGFLRELETGRESRIVPGLWFVSGVWLQPSVAVVSQRNHDAKAKGFRGLN